MNDMKPADLTALLSGGYARARRVAHALSGNDAVGRAVAGVLVRRSIELLERWRDTSSPENWFYHHAVLNTRTVDAVPADPNQDPLVLHTPAAADPAYVAFVRALRHLPVQQREAFILHHGERLNTRLLGVAMDCSMQAAETHLRAATDALQTVSQGAVERQAGVMAGAYAAMQAAQPDATPVVQVHLARARRRIWFGRARRIAVVALILAALICAFWIFRDNGLGLVR